MVMKCSDDNQKILLPMVTENKEIIEEESKKAEDFDSFYDKDQQAQE